MNRPSRRTFLSASIAATAGVALARTLKPIGVQLYTVRTVVLEQPELILKAIEQIGYREAEVTYNGIDSLWPAFKDKALKPVSLHLSTAFFSKEQDKLPRALDDAKKRGFHYVVCPAIAREERGDADVMKRFGETLTRAGEMARKAGLELCYHNHAFEFRPVGNTTLLDTMLGAADPKLVGLELDIMWSTVGGVSPVKVLEKYGSRVKLMHLKNVAPGVGPQYDEKVDKSAFREVGNGAVDVPAVLKAAAKAGVKHYFVEQDQTPGDPLQSLRQSYDYLAKLNY